MYEAITILSELAVIALWIHLYRNTVKVEQRMGQDIKQMDALLACKAQGLSV